MTFRLALLLSLTMFVGCSGGFGISCSGPASDTPAASSPAAQRASQILQVAANRGWQDTGITVTPQQKFQLRYRSGEITDKDVKIVDARGSDYICGDPGCCEPMPDERRSALVARIAGEVFFVGNGGEYTSPAGGTIFLRVNDCDDGLLDNAGTLSVEFIP